MERGWTRDRLDGGNRSAGGKTSSAGWSPPLFVITVWQLLLTVDKVVMSVSVCCACYYCKACILLNIYSVFVNLADTRPLHFRVLCRLTLFAGTLKASQQQPGARCDLPAATMVPGGITPTCSAMSEVLKSPWGSVGPCSGGIASNFTRTCVRARSCRPSQRPGSMGRKSG